MDLKTFYTPLTREERDAFALLCKTSRGHLQNVMYGQRPCAPELAVAIEQESKAAIRRWDLRPDDWRLIWPELIGAEGAPVIPEPAPQA